MDLFNYLHNLDLKILHFVNGDLAHKANDFVLKLWTAEAPWFALAGFFFVQTAYRRQWREFKTLLWLGATVGVSDAVCAQIIKPFAARLRPCKVEELVRVVEGCAGSLSFPSNHASNAAAFAVFWLLWKGPRAGALALSCMFVVGFSRIYLGNHYPSDVFGGFVFGSVIACLSYLLYSRFMRHEKKGQTEAV